MIATEGVVMIVRMTDSNGHGGLNQPEGVRSIAMQSEGLGGLRGGGGLGGWVCEKACFGLE